MANTTDIIITCFEEDGAIGKIAEVIGISLPKISNSDICGGQKSVCFESYAASYRSIGKEKIDLLIQEFKRADWDFPEFAVMIIDDDDGAFSGIVKAV